MLTELEVEVSKIIPIPIITAKEYEEKINQIVHLVDDELASHPHINHLIGTNSIEMMHNNHLNHAMFISNVFLLGQYKLLTKIIPWVYNTYTAQGFSLDYFPVEIKAFMNAVNKLFDSSHAESINRFYQWMIDHHNLLVKAASASINDEDEYIDSLQDVQKELLTALINGDSQKCYHIAKSKVNSLNDYIAFSLNVVQPVMYEIGKLWESGDISVAEEHLASAIANRMITILRTQLPYNTHKKGRIIVTSAPNEFHELGAWILSDLLEIDGWEVKYLGANTPANELIRMMTEYHPDVLMISISMVFNLEKARQMIENVRIHELFNNTKILTGGYVFHIAPDIFNLLGADDFALNAGEGLNIANQWFEEMKG